MSNSTSVDFTSAESADTSDDLHPFGPILADSFVKT